MFLRKVETAEEALQLGVPSDTGLAWTRVENGQVLVKIKQALRDQGLEEEKERSLAAKREAAGK